MTKRKTSRHRCAKTKLHVENLEKRELLAADLMQSMPMESMGPRQRFEMIDDSEQVEEYASIDGSGNNIENPELGMAGAQLLREADADYADGVSEPAGEDRPSAREISNALSADDGLSSERLLSAFVYAWGQFVDHDISLTTSGGDAFNIEVPQGDEYFDPFNTGSAVIPLTRSIYDADVDADSPREQITVVTSWVDGSAVYGSDDATALALRTLEGGKLKTSDGDLLPFNNLETLPDGTLPMDNDANIVPDSELFAAGDVRANENIELTSLHTLFVRDHNRLADEIGAADPSLTDEQIYQEARAIVVGELQAITYNEWLPSFLGEQAISRYDGYDSSVDPGITNEFSTAAFRFGHSLLGDDVEFLDNEGNEIAEEVPLSHAFSNPALVSENGIDSIIKYLASDPSAEFDTQVVDSVRNFLFGPPGSGGLDLASLNIQRGRDHGLSDYNSTREAYGLDRVTSFEEITSDPDLQTKLEQLYGSVDNIDLWVGGMVEDHVEGASVGKTFQTIIADQFERLRDGDRFWYQNSFSGQTLREIHQTSLSDVIERNTELTNLQDDVFFFDSSISGTVASTNVTEVARGWNRTGVEDQVVQLLSDEGELIAETTTDARGRYEFGVADGLRTGDYEVHLQTLVDDALVSLESREVAIPTGDVRLRGIDFVLAGDVADDVEQSTDSYPVDDQDPQRRADRQRGSKRERTISRAIPDARGTNEQASTVTESAIPPKVAATDMLFAQMMNEENTPRRRAQGNR